MVHVLRNTKHQIFEHPQINHWHFERRQQQSSEFNEKYSLVPKDLICNMSEKNGHRWHVSKKGEVKFNYQLANEMTVRCSHSNQTQTELYLFIYFSFLLVLFCESKCIYSIDGDRKSSVALTRESWFSESFASMRSKKEISDHHDRYHRVRLFD